MREFGTKIVAGVTPGKEGELVDGIPVYDTVKKAVVEKGANSSIIFVPAPFTKDAIIEAIDAGIKLVIIITEHVPFHDMVEVLQYSKIHNTRIIGPNCPGIVAPGISKIGIMPNSIFRKGNVGVLSRSGTLTYEIVNAITESGMGISTAIGLGGDPVIGMTFIDGLSLFQDDVETEAVVLVGEIGGTAEEEAAEFIEKNIDKPVVAYIAGRSAPPGKRMGHAGAIISRGRGTADSKVKAFENAGVKVAHLPQDLPELLHKAMKQ
jgi:succinyl-CoA synthetase alpha subunit